MAGKKDGGISIVRFGEKGEDDRRGQFLDLFRKWPVPDNEFFLNLGLFLTPQALSRILFMDHLYRQGLEVQGVVMEFGCRWGQNLSLFSAMRGIYEPFNRLRKIVGFDTFEGFKSVDKKDHASLKKGDYSVSRGYEEFLEKVMSFQEKESPLPHIRKFEVIKGDASVKIKEYLSEHPETIISLAYFDMDLYKPTLDCLKAIKDRLPKGAVLGFDELNDPLCPGETEALREALGIRNCRIKRFPYNSRTSYMIVE